MDWGIRAGDTDKTIYLRLRDSTTGLAKTGLAFNSAGAVASYTLPLAARAAITLATQTVTGAHTDGGFVEVDATNCKGLYRLDLPDAAIASGAFSIISIEFDGTIEESMMIELLPPEVNVTQWLGTAAATPSVAGVPEVDVTHWLGTAPATPTVAGVPEVDLTHVAGSTTDVSTIPASVASILVDTGATLQAELDGIQADTEDIQSRLPAALVGGRIDATVDGTGMEAGAIAAIADGVWDEVVLGAHTGVGAAGLILSKTYLANLATSGSVNDASATTTEFDTDLTEANDFWNDALLTFTSGALSGQSRVVLDYANASGHITLDEALTSAPANGVTFQIRPSHIHPKSQIADAVWQETLADHSGTVGSTAEALSAAGSAGDPWSTQLPGAYGAGSAGKIIGDNINATVSSRSSQTSVDDLPTNAELTTALGTADDAVLAAIAALNDLDAAGVRAAVGLAAANLDTQLGDIKGATFNSATDSLEAIRNQGDSAWVTATSVTVSDKTGFKLASDGMDAVLIESSITAGATLTDDAGTQLTSINARQAMSLTLSSLGGVLAGAATTNVTIKPAGKPAGNTRVDATVTADGNRTALTLKVPT